MLQQIPKLLTWANKKGKRTINRFTDFYGLYYMVLWFILHGFYGLHLYGLHDDGHGIYDGISSNVYKRTSI